MNILIIGSNGFIAKNLIVRLKPLRFNLIYHSKQDGLEILKEKILKSNLIFYLAGVNRVVKNKEYEKNIELTKKIVDVLKNTNRKIKIIFSSSTQVLKKNSYSHSKKKSEEILLSISKKKNIKLIIYRLPNVFGKWAKPYYNSVVATFCNQLTRNKKISIHSNKKLKLIYIDDLIDEFLSVVKDKKSKILRNPKNTFQITVKELATILTKFKYAVTDINFQFNNKIIKSLYSTYLSYLPDSKISFDLKLNKDVRGNFIELFKNQNSGQISFFSIKPKKIRGNHYHNTKTEKFLLLSGSVKVNFINLFDNKKFSIKVTEKKPKIFITKPGYAHNIINISKKDAKFVVWSNEIFDKNKPDTYKYVI